MKGLKIVAVLFLLPLLISCGNTTAGNMDHSPLVGRWEMKQIAISPDGITSLCHGEFVAYSDNTFTLKNACKVGHNKTLIIWDSVQQGVTGTWVQTGKRSFEAWYDIWPGYVYTINISGNTGTFMLMTTSDEFDTGNFEFGICLRNSWNEADWQKYI